MWLPLETTQRPGPTLWSEFLTALGGPRTRSGPSATRKLSAPNLAAGSKLGPSEIRSLLGVGGMGEVYRSHDTRLGRNVALKVAPWSWWKGRPWPSGLRREIGRASCRERVSVVV